MWASRSLAEVLDNELRQAKTDHFGRRGVTDFDWSRTAVEFELSWKKKTGRETILRPVEVPLLSAAYCSGLLAEVAAVVGSYRITPD